MKFMILTRHFLVLLFLINQSSWSFKNLVKYSPKYTETKIYMHVLRTIGNNIFGSNGEDVVWDAVRLDAEIEARNEPLLASFMHAAILSHNSLENSLSFHMANQLESSTMISTQIQALFLEAFQKSPGFRKSVRLDILAVMQRDPAVRTSPDVILYFKGFQALQTHRVSHWLWTTRRQTLALFLQTQANNALHVDIHPGAKLGDGIMIDHGTGVVIGETAVVGDNVSMLHHVTLGGAGTKSGIRHPQVGNGVLIGAGATILGNVNIGSGANIGACSMVLEDVPPNAVAVGVPARIIVRKQTAPTPIISPAFSMDTSILDYII